MTPAVSATTPTLNEVERKMKQDDEIDIEEEAKAWAKEFGMDAAETIKGLVMIAMDDYSYLRERAIK